MNFKYSEVIKSKKAVELKIDNNVPLSLMNNLMVSVVGIQRVRDLLKVPINCTSWYRCDKLNKVVKGKENSAHKKCLAVDFQIKGNLLEAFNKIKDSTIEFDQLIFEKNSKGTTWIHISFDPKNRKQVFFIG